MRKTNPEWIRIACRLLIFISVMVPVRLFAQYPVNYFKYPVGARIGMVANLGELRANHWHMGLDIRTDQAVNKQVFAAADGYVARIKVEPFGFGQAIYINHPNGLTTLYAHLNKFFPALDDYVKREQYKRESWAVELQIPPGMFEVKKGQFIAWSGTTGGSGGPHVHFEIRNTATDVCINPLFFGLPFPDHTPPDLRKIALYDRARSTYDQSPRIFSVVKKGRSYGLSGTDLMVTASPIISFAVETFDRMDGSANRDGVYLGKVCIDNKPQVEFVLDSIGYNETRYMNAHIDYSYEARTGVYLQHLSRLPGFRGDIYRPINGDGVIRLPDTATHDIEIEILDSRKNSSALRFKLKYQPKGASKDKETDSWQPLIPNYVNVVEKQGFEAYLPENCLYDTVPAVFSMQPGDATESLSPTFQLADPSIPVHRSFTVRIKPDKPVQQTWRDRVLVEWSYKQKKSYSKASWQEDWISAPVSDFGYFRAVVDTEPPTVNPPGSGAVINLSSARRILFTPKDNTGIRDLRVELDGKWLRFTNDKGRHYIYVFDEHFPRGEHELKVVVQDIAGNQAVHTWKVKR